MSTKAALNMEILEKPQGLCIHCKAYSNSIFKTLTEKEHEEICHSKKPSLYKKGEIIFHADRVAYEIFCINTGIVKLVYKGDNGKSQIVRLYGEGDIFGYRAMLAHETYNCSCIALEDTTVCTISRDLFLKLIRQNESFAIEMFKKVATDLETAEHKVVAIAQKNIRGRLADSLLFLQRRHGIDKDNNINVHFSREELSEFVGTSIETTIRTLSDFQKEGLITLYGRAIKINDIKKLQRIAES